MKTQFSAKHPISFFTLSFYSVDKEKKFQREYTQKSLNTIRLGLFLCCMVMLIIDLYYFYTKHMNQGWAFLDGIFIFYAFLVIVWSYYDFDYFSAVLQPGIGFGVFCYMVFHLLVYSSIPSPPTFYMIAFIALFMLKIAFRFIFIYCMIFMVYYQIMFIFYIKSGIRLLADDVLLISSMVSILAASYLYEFYVRKTFLKKETFLAERRKLIEEKKKNRNILRNVLPLYIADKWNHSNVATVPEKGKTTSFFF